MSSNKRMLVTLIAALLSVNAHAEVAFVTDMLQLDMYKSGDFAGSPMRKLRSGDRVNVISKDGRSARVRTDDGAEGWVKALYLVADEPARTRLNRLETANGGLEKVVSNLRTQLEAEQAKSAALQQEHDGVTEQTVSTEQELIRLREENTVMLDKLAAYAGSVPINWLLITLAISLLGGFAGGWFFIDKRSRAKHGGYRIY